MRRAQLVWILLLLSGMAAHIVALSAMRKQSRQDVAIEMQVALPRLVQVFMAGGDRYLAANLAGFRALVASTEKMNADNYHIQGIVQSDAAWLNPAHQDNYYIAAAILPWNGEVAAGDYVLRKAIDSRPFDWSPVFYYAFNRMYFDHDHVAAANWLRFGAKRAIDVNDHYLLENMAARWYEQGYDTRTAILVVEAMAKGARDSEFRKYLNMRVTRLNALLKLEKAAAEYQDRFHQSAASLAELKRSGVIDRIPEDPFGFGFAIKNGKATLLNNSPKTLQ
jgi:hypothetical protein